MNIELLVSITKHTNTSITQTQTKPQETPEFKLNKQLDFFSFHSPTSLSDEQKRLLAVICFETTNSVFNITDENSSFSISTPRCLSPEIGGEVLTS